MDWINLAEVTGSCEHGNERLASIKVFHILDKLRDNFWRGILILGFIYFG